MGSRDLRVASAQTYLGPNEGAAAVHLALRPEAEELVAVVPDVLAEAVALVDVHALVPVALVEHLDAVPLREVITPPALVPVLTLVDVHTVPLVVVARERDRERRRSEEVNRIGHV